MAKKIIIDATYPDNIRVALINEKNIIESIEYETENKQQIKGNIYLAKIVRIEPSLQAAFIEYGSMKNGFLPFSEIHPDYYNIPTEDKKANEAKVTFSAITPPKITSEDIAEQEGERIKITDDELAADPDSLQIKEDVEIEPQESLGEDDSPNKAVQYKIQDVIKKGQVILVQAQKDERGNKGASFSSFISLAGKYCVLMPNMPKHNGISRRISNLEERRRLRDIVTSLTSEDSGSASIIVRTDGIGKTTYEIKKDYDYLARLWNRVREATMKATAPAFIHMEEGIIIKTIRDMFDNSVSEILLQGPKAYKNALEFVQNILPPADVAKLKEYKAKTPIFTKFGIESQLANLYQPISHLPSGGYIVINPTEALISIDVNSGKATGERNIEETAFKTNLEAAAEIARQLKLRDLSGLIVIDFIDMYDSKNRKAVEKALRQSFSRDRARIQTGNLSPFGLLEMSRQRIKSSFLESNSKICHHCNGKGLVRADQSNAMLILRTVENEIFKNHVDIVNVFANIDAVLYLINNKRREISSIEERYKMKLNFFQDINATADSFSIEKIKNAAVTEDPKEYAMLDSANFSEEGSDVNSDFDRASENTSTFEESKENKRPKKKRPNNRKRGPRRSEGEGEGNIPSESAPMIKQEALVDSPPKIEEKTQDVDGNVAVAPKAHKSRPRRMRKKIGAPSADVVEG